MAQRKAIRLGVLIGIALSCSAFGSTGEEKSPDNNEFGQGTEKPMKEADRMAEGMTRVADIMAADTARRGDPPEYDETYYAAMWQQTGGFTQVLFQRASEAVASAWYTAWVNAGQPDPVYPGGNGDCDSDGDRDLADFACMQRCASSVGTAPSCAPADFDADNDVDATDLAAFATLLQGPS